MRNIFIDEGNLGADPVLKYVPVNTTTGTEQRAALELQVRFDVQKKKGDTYEDVGGFWAKVTQWGKRAEINHQFLRKGCRILVAGELSQHNYIVQKGERQGQTGTATEIDAAHIALVLLGIEDIVFAEKPSRSDQEAAQHEFVADTDSIPFDQ